VSSRESLLSALKASARDIEPGQKFVVDDFRSDDAPGVAQLYYAVYGDNFPIDYVYDPEAIRAATASGQTNFVVGRTGTGDIVGLYGLYRNPPGKYIMEGGAWIVLPAYRNTTLAMRLARHGHGPLADRLGLNLLFGQNVCDHVLAQKLSLKMNAHPFALEIEAMPPRPEDGPNGQRISLLDTFCIYHDVRHDIYLPARYDEILKGIYTVRGLERDFREDAPPQGAADCSVQVMDSASLAKLMVRKAGSDLGDRLALMERDCPGRHAYQLFIPLGQPGATHAADAAREAGYFFGGILPMWDDTDYLLMQKLNSDPDFSRIELLTDEAKALLAFVVKDREALPGRP
jgi:hypothetical protein